MKRKPVLPERKTPEGALPCWETFFMCQRSPVFRSQVLAALMTGTRLVVAHLPTSALLDAVLVGFATRVYCDAEIVDDWAELLRRTEEEWERPDWTCRVFDNLHLQAASAIVQGRADNFVCFEEQYIPDLVQWYLENDLPEYFSREVETLPNKEAVSCTTKMRGTATKLNGHVLKLTVKGLGQHTSKNLSGVRKKAKK
jgi:hypothetical protein